MMIEQEGEKRRKEKISIANARYTCEQENTLITFFAQFNENDKFHLEPHFAAFLEMLGDDGIAKYYFTEMLKKEVEEKIAINANAQDVNTILLKQVLQCFKEDQRSKNCFEEIDKRFFQPSDQHCEDVIKILDPWRRSNLTVNLNEKITLFQSPFGKRLSKINTKISESETKNQDSVSLEKEIYRSIHFLAKSNENLKAEDLQSLRSLFSESSTTDRKAQFTSIIENMNPVALDILDQGLSAVLQSKQQESDQEISSLNFVKEKIDECKKKLKVEPEKNIIKWLAYSCFYYEAEQAKNKLDEKIKEFSQAKFQDVQDVQDKAVKKITVSKINLKCGNKIRQVINDLESGEINALSYNLDLLKEKQLAKGKIAVGKFGLNLFKVVRSYILQRKLQAIKKDPLKCGLQSYPYPEIRKKYKEDAGGVFKGCSLVTVKVPKEFAKIFLAIFAEYIEKQREVLLKGKRPPIRFFYLGSNSFLGWILTKFTNLWIWFANLFRKDENNKINKTTYYNCFTIIRDIYFKALDRYCMDKLKEKHVKSVLLDEWLKKQFKPEYQKYKKDFVKEHPQIKQVFQRNFLDLFICHPSTHLNEVLILDRITKALTQFENEEALWLTRVGRESKGIGHFTKIRWKIKKKIMNCNIFNLSIETKQWISIPFGRGLQSFEDLKTALSVCGDGKTAYSLIRDHLYLLEMEKKKNKPRSGEKGKNQVCVVNDKASELVAILNRNLDDLEKDNFKQALKNKASKSRQDQQVPKKLNKVFYKDGKCLLIYDKNKAKPEKEKAEEEAERKSSQMGKDFSRGCCCSGCCFFAQKCSYLLSKFCSKSSGTNQPINFF